MAFLGFSGTVCSKRLVYGIYNNKCFGFCKYNNVFGFTFESCRKLLPQGDVSILSMMSQKRHLALELGGTLLGALVVRKCSTSACGGGEHVQCASVSV